MQPAGQEHPCEQGECGDDGRREDPAQRGAADDQHDTDERADERIIRETGAELGVAEMVLCADGNASQEMQRGEKRCRPPLDISRSLKREAKGTTEIASSRTSPT